MTVEDDAAGCLGALIGIVLVISLLVMAIYYFSLICGAISIVLGIVYGIVKSTINFFVIFFRHVGNRTAVSG